VKMGFMKKAKCRWCGKLTDKFWIIADDMENPKPYCLKCLEKLKMEALERFYLESNPAAQRQKGK